MDLIKPYGNFIENFQGVIVSEPDLLTPLENYPHPNEAANIMAQFQANYNAYLLSFKQILPENGICVFIFPQLHTSDNRTILLEFDCFIEKIWIPVVFNFCKQYFISSNVRSCLEKSYHRTGYLCY